jgi:hypothetical protein
MSTKHSADLIKAVRAGVLSDVSAALKAGADCQCSDDLGTPGLPLRTAAFNGFNDIICELVAHGATLDAGGASLITLAVRGGRRETVRLLIELGATIPAGVQTGLSEQEICAAQEAGQRRQQRLAAAQHSGTEVDGATADEDTDQAPPAATATEEEDSTELQKTVASPNGLLALLPLAGDEDPERAARTDDRSENAIALELQQPPSPQKAWTSTANIEEINLRGTYGVDTNVLDADLARLANNSAEETPKHADIDLPALEFGALERLKFWKKKD